MCGRFNAIAKLNMDGHGHLVRASHQAQTATSAGSQAGRSGAISTTWSADDAAGQQVEVDR